MWAVILFKFSHEFSFCLNKQYMMFRKGSNLSVIPWKKCIYFVQKLETLYRILYHSSERKVDYAQSSFYQNGDACNRILPNYKKRKKSRSKMLPPVGVECKVSDFHTLHDSTKDQESIAHDCTRIQRLEASIK